MYAAGVFFVGNTLVANLKESGAFEVYYDGELIFSKLREGRMISVEELIGRLARRVPADVARVTMAAHDALPAGMHPAA